MRPWLLNGLLFLTYAYSILLLGWAVGFLFFGDRTWWLFLLNSLAFYLFLPLPLVALTVVVTRRQELWFILATGLLLWLYLYGGLFIRPTLTRAVSADQVLTVMTYNMLQHSPVPEPTVAAIRSANADVVALQELNSSVAAALTHELQDVYPYQLLMPSDEDTSGMGVISRYPLHDTKITLPGEWIGAPQVLELTFGERSVVLLNIHVRSTSLGYGGNIRIDPTQIEASIREREAQVQAITTLVQDQQAPVLVLGDLNTSELSHAYQLISRELTDVWRAVGYGLGHTFPGADTPGTSRPQIAGIRIPQWLVRIDYIFASEEWQPLTATLGQWDGVSDHRPVVARLYLQ